MYKSLVLVKVRKERPNFIIATDFLSTHNCNLSHGHKLFSMGEDRVECIPERVKVSRARLKPA